MHKFLLLLTLVLGLSLRIWHLDIPLLEFVPSRQIQTAEITANLSKNNFNVFLPEVNYYGRDNDKYFLIEFPAYNLVVSGLDQITGIKEINGRIVSVVFYFIASLLLYALVRDLIDRKTALASLFFFSISPLNVLTSRSFLPEEMMIASCLAALYLLYIWSKNKKPYLFTISLLFFSLALILKITSFLFLLLPIVYLIHRGSKTNWIKKTLVYIFVSIVPSILWIYHAAKISKNLTTESASIFDISNWFGINIFFDPKYYSNIFGIEYNLVLLPLGIFLFLIGIVSVLNFKRNKSFLVLWFVSTILYFLVFNKHTMTHEYYHLPILLIGSIFVGVGIVKVVENLKVGAFFKVIVASAICLLLLVSSYLSLSQKAYRPIERFRSVVSLGRTVESITGENDLIIGLMDSGPAVVHYANRKGWGLETDVEKAIEHRQFFEIGSKYVDPKDRVNELRKKGAVVLAVGYKKQLDDNLSFKNYLYENFVVLEENEDTVIFDLKKAILN